MLSKVDLYRLILTQKMSDLLKSRAFLCRFLQKPYLGDASYNTHEIFQSSVFGILWNIMIILRKMFQILTFHDT